MPQRPASADWHGQIIRYPRQTLVGPGQWHEGPESLYTTGAGFYLWWRHEEAPVRFQRPRAPRWMLIGPFTTRAAAVRHRKAMDAAGQAGRMAPVQGQGAKQWTAAQARRFGRGYGSSIYAAEAQGDDREAGRLLDEFEARDAMLPPALSRIFVEAYQAARWKRLPGGRRAPASGGHIARTGRRVANRFLGVGDETRAELRDGTIYLSSTKPVNAPGNAWEVWRMSDNHPRLLEAVERFLRSSPGREAQDAYPPSSVAVLTNEALGREGLPFPRWTHYTVDRWGHKIDWKKEWAEEEARYSRQFARKGRRAPAAMRGRRAPAAMRIGKTIYEILDTTRLQPRPGPGGGATRWKLRGPDGKEHKLERRDGRGQPYYKSSGWSRPHLIPAEEVRYLPATAGERPKPPRPAREPVARGIQTHEVTQSSGGRREGGQHLVTVSPGAWVRLHGTREVSPWTRGVGYGKTVLKPYDLTFKLGDVAVNGSYNLTYTGVIESIGPKRILVVGVPVGRKSMDLRSFSFYNRDFDAERIARENADTMMRI